MQAMNYDKLLGAARACGLKQKDLAQIAGMSAATMSLKISGRYPFTADEIRSIVARLGVPPEHIGEYFFTPKVQKTKPDEGGPA